MQGKFERPQEGKLLFAILVAGESSFFVLRRVHLHGVGKGGLLGPVRIVLN